jgi:hypothetical protein
MAAFLHQYTAARFSHNTFIDLLHALFPFFSIPVQFMSGRLETAGSGSGGIAGTRNFYCTIY